MQLKILSAVIGSLIIVSLPVCSQVMQRETNIQSNNRPWNNKQAAVVLTYDDALNVHLTHAIPALDSAGIRATFYISDYFGGLQQQLPKWKAAALKGHELANHTVYHPCTGGLPGREFVKPDYDLNNYTIRRITDEIKTMNTLLKAIDGKTKRTFAFPCSDTKIRDTPYVNGVKNEFVGARAVRAEMPRMEQVNLFNIPSYMVNGETGEQLIGLIRQALAKKTLLVFLFHGVGGEHGLNVLLEAHATLLQYLKQLDKEIWIAPMIEVAEYIRTKQQAVK